MGPSEQGFSKRTKSPHRCRHPRTEQKIVLRDARIEGASNSRWTNSSEVLRTIMAIKIGHDPYPGKDLAFSRQLPTVRVSPINRREVSVVIGVPEEHVPAGGNLGARETSEQKQSKDDEASFSHDDLNLTFLTE